MDSLLPCANIFCTMYRYIDGVEILLINENPRTAVVKEFSVGIGWIEIKVLTTVAFSFFNGSKGQNLQI